jgi:hypothetical protein
MVRKRSDQIIYPINYNYSNYITILFIKIRKLYKHIKQQNALINESRTGVTHYVT